MNTEVLARPDSRHAYKLTELINRLQTTDDEEVLVELMEMMETAGEEFRDHLQELVDARNEVNASIAGVDAEIKRLEDLRLEREVRVNSIERYINTWLSNIGMSEVLLPRNTVRIKTNPIKVVVLDESLIPEPFMRQPPTPKMQPDKVAIKEALQSGIEVAGCELAQETKLQIK